MEAAGSFETFVPI